MPTPIASRLNEPKRDSPGTTSALFDISIDRARAFLQWARVLACVEGSILTMGAYMIIARTAGHSINGQALGAIFLAIVSIGLGWKVGKGSVFAAVTLLGLALSRGIATYIPGAPEWWTTFPVLTVIELLVFGQGVRGAISLTLFERAPSTSSSRRPPVAFETRLTKQAPPNGSIASSNVRPSPVAAASAAKPARKYYPPDLTEGEAATSDAFRTERRFLFLDLMGVGAVGLWKRKPVLDLVVVGAVALYSLKLMSTPVIHSEGLQGFSEALEVVFGFINLVLATLLLIGSRAARHNKRWGVRLRSIIYVAFGFQILVWVKLKI